jgi:hypothetical protein
MFDYIKVYYSVSQKALCSREERKEKLSDLCGYLALFAILLRWRCLFEGGFCACVDMTTKIAAVRRVIVFNMFFFYTH